MDTNLQYWIKKLDDYSRSEWAQGPNVFAEQAEVYFPKGARILELGAGVGQDGNWFAAKGYDVLQTDLTYDDTEHMQDRITRLRVDMESDWPFGEEEFDVVYAHLSLHYFTSKKTEEIIKNIYKSLRPKGVFAMFVNSQSDSEAAEGEEIEYQYRLLGGGIKKRFFSRDSLAPYVKDFLPYIFDEKGFTYKDAKLGNASLVRFVGTKKYTDKELALPFVGAIVRRSVNGEEHILLQVRWKPVYEPQYAGTFEIPAGVLDSGHESVFDAVSREVLEETGLQVKSIAEKETVRTEGLHDDEVLSFDPFIAVQMTKGVRPYFGVLFICEVEEGELKPQEEETREPRWVTVTELKRMIDETPEKFFTLELAALKKYVEINRQEAK